MKKIFFLILLMTACCLIGQAQTATPAKKAMRLAPGTPIVDLQTGETVRVTPAAPGNLNNISGSLTGINSSGNSGSTTLRSHMKALVPANFTIRANPNQSSGSTRTVPANARSFNQNN